MNKNIMLAIGIAVALFATVVYVDIITTQEKVDYSNNVGIASSIGCLKTYDTPEVFEARQALYKQVLGYEFVRCS